MSKWPCLFTVLCFTIELCSGCVCWLQSSWIKLPYKPIYKSTSCIRRSLFWAKLAEIAQTLVLVEVQNVILFQNKIPGLLSLVNLLSVIKCISGINYIRLPLVTMTNRTKINRTMKSLFKSGIISGTKSEVHRIHINLGTNVNRIICFVWITIFGIYLLLNYMEIYQNSIYY